MSVRNYLSPKDDDVRNFATPASRILGREVRVLFLAPKPIDTLAGDVITEACEAGRRMGQWLGSSGLMDDSNYTCYFEHVHRIPGKLPHMANINPSHVWASVIEYVPDVVVACGDYAKKFLSVYLPEENTLEWYNPSGRRHKESSISDVHLAWALGHEVDWKVESFYEDAELVNRRRAARDLFEQALRDAGILEQTGG